MNRWTDVNRGTDLNGWTDVNRWKDLNRWTDGTDGQIRKAAETDIRIKQSQDNYWDAARGLGMEPPASPESVLKGWVSKANPAP